jgi:hypothetical protein
MLNCPSCRALLPERVETYALHTIEGGQSVRLSVDLDTRNVHIDVGAAHGEPRHAATVQAIGTAEVVFRVWEPLLLGMGLRRRLPGLVAHAWQRALDIHGTVGMLDLLQSRRPTQRRTAPPSEAESDHEADRGLREAGQALERTGIGRGPEPGVDGALAKIYAEIDDWIEQYGSDQAPEHLKDPAALCAAIAMVFRIELKNDPTKMIALAAGAMTRLILPPERHQLPPDPFEDDTE